jgi:ferredoxin
VSIKQGRGVWGGGLRGTVIELPCIATLKIQKYLFARQLGFEVAFFCPSKKREKCPKRRATEEYLALIREAEGIIRPKPRGKTVYSDKLTELAAPLAVDKDEWTQLARLELYRVKADENLCTLCGACVKACPTNSLTLTRDDKFRLLFNHSSCIGCNACVKICREKALTIEKATNLSLLSAGNTIEIATSEIARCRKCGKEIGPGKMIMRLDRKLAERGVSKEQRESLWLCEECKKEATLEEF